MKKAILSLTLIMAAVIGLNAQTTSPDVTGGPEISIDKTVHDYGTIQQGADGTCEFTVTNTGTEPLIISKCKGSCGCTVPKCDATPVLPGETSIITVKYDTKRVGPINKAVTITSNAVNEPTLVVRIKGKVEGEAPTNTGTPVKPAPTGVPATK